MNSFDVCFVSKKLEADIDTSIDDRVFFLSFLLLVHGSIKKPYRTCA